jgi:hypothetical protein
MLPIARSDHCDALDLLMVVFYDPNVIQQSRSIVPAIEAGNVDYNNLIFPCLLIGASTFGAICRKSSAYNFASS